MCLAYMVQALDKGVIGPASIMGWLPDINAQGQDYALTSTILWIGIIAGEPLVSRVVCSMVRGQLVRERLTGLSCRQTSLSENGNQPRSSPSQCSSGVPYVHHS